MKEAACREYPSEWWFGQAKQRAKAICADCPVRSECAQEARQARVQPVAGSKDPARWLEEHIAPAIPRVAAIEPVPL